MTYDEIVAALMTLNEVPQNKSDENFARILPSAFLYAEGRIFRDLSLIITAINQPAQMTARVRQFILPASILALRNLNLVTPAGPLTFTSKRTPLERISPEALDYFWPQDSFKVGKPQKYAIVGDAQPMVSPPNPMTPVDQPQVLSHIVRVMPTPDQAYYVEAWGDVRPLTLSSSCSVTYLTFNYPELYIAACMVFLAGYQRDFGSQAEDPQRAVSWEGQYQNLRAGALIETARMKGEGPGFTAQPPTPVAMAGAPNATG